MITRLVSMPLSAGRNLILCRSRCQGQRQAQFHAAWTAEPSQLVLMKLLRYKAVAQKTRSSP